MATGIVRGLIGSVSVTSREGITRELRIGDTVEINDTVQAASGSTVHIAFDNGNFATVGSNEKLVLDASVIDPMAGSDNKTATDQNVADIQAMIAAGADPTEIAEATAAGGDSGTRGDPDHSGSHSFVVVDQAAARGEVTPGFETGTFSSPVPETENDDGRIDTFLADHDTDANPDSPDVLPPAPDVPPSNSNPVITDEGQGLLVKESGVGTTDQGGKPGWAIGDHNHAIAGKPVDEGSFKVTDADGDTLTATLLDKNGVPVKGVVTDDSGTMTVQTEYGTLTVTPTEGADGSVTYTYHYELDNTLADSLNEGDDPVQEHFQIEVSDGHGGTVTQPVDITIEGTNDAPTFNGHGQNIQLKEEGVYNGNHETTDDHKDNGFVSEQNDRPKVQGDLSTYVTDADKGADLTYTVDHFNVKNSTADSVETTLYTANNTTVIDETTGKPVQITVEMVGTPTIDASGIQTIHTNYGTLTVDTKTGHYTFELGGSEEADKLVNSMAAGEKFTFQFETLVTDQFGAIGKHVLSVVIEGANDIPTLTVDKLVLDVTEQGENVSPEYAGTDSGHAQGTDIDRGADLHYSLIDENGRETTIIKTDYGTLTIDADGKYHFTIDNTSDAVKALGEGDTRSAGPFTIRVTDEHGAYTEQEIEVNVHGAKDAPVISDHLAVNEHGLDNASDASETAAIKAPDGYRIIDAENGQHGTVSQDADGNWHYTLSGAIDSGKHPGTNTVTGADTVNMTVEDANGNRFTIDVKVDIVDDVPTISNPDTIEGSVTAGHESSDHGKLDFDFGADNGDGKQLTVSIGGHTVDITDITTKGSYDIAGELGTLTIYADGTYHYKANPNVSPGQDSFDVTIRDADGDMAETKIDVNVDAASGPDGSQISHITVNEHGLDHVSDASETASIKAPDGYKIIDAEDGQHGTVSQDADGNWHYTLSGAIDSGNHPGTNTVTGADTVNMTVEDGNGNRFTVDVKVDIVDDVPVIDLGGHDYQNIHVDSGSTIHEATGSIHYDFGADDGQGKSLTVSIGERTVDASGILENGSQTIQGEFGKLTINADGSYSYQANPNIHGGAQDSFVITITDADGDTKDVKLDIDVTPSGITAGNASAIVSEHDIAGNDHANTGSDALHGQDNVPGNPAVDESGFSGHLDLDYGVNGAAHDDAFTWNIPSGNGVQAMIDGSWQSVTWSVNGTTLTGTAGGETVFTLTIDPATGDYQAALNAALQHNAPDGTDMSDSNVDFSGQTDASSGLHFGYTITDASGNTAKGGLDVDVQDDIPVFSQSSDSVTVTDHHYYTDNSELKFSDDHIGEGNHSVSFGDNLSISAGTVHYGNDGNISTIDSSDGTLYYKNPADSKFAGLGVQDTVVDDALMNGQDYNGKGRFPEINYSQGDNSSEAIVIDLNGKIAYGMNIGLSNFFGGKGEGAEKALFTFYLNGEIVDVKELTSAQNSGLVNGTFNSVTAGFDKVVISAIDNGISQGPLKDNSDFSISSIQFITASGQPLVTAEGHVEATSADGIKSYDFGDMAFEMADGEKISLTHTTTSNGDIITGTLADGTVVLQGFLSDNGTWSLHQYVSGIHNVGSNNLTIDFVATDNDGDRTTHDTVIPAAPDIAHVEVNEHGLDNVADTLADPGTTSSQNDLLVDGSGHEILVGQVDNDLLIGDGDNNLPHDGSPDHLHNLLGTHAQGDDPAAGIHHLFDHGTAQEIHDFTHGIENLNVENSHDGNDHLYGGTGDDILIGMGGNDHLYGGEGHDILLGGSGNDVLVGGKGDDILSGGTGNDIFKYMTGDLDGVTHGDTITDFHLGNLNESNGQLDANADVLDISELISGHDKPTSLESLVNGGYLSFDDVSENADGTLTVKLSIDVDGKDGDAHMTNLATITMTGFEHHAGTDIVQDLMDQLVHNQNIKF